MHGWLLTLYLFGWLTGAILFARLWLAVRATSLRHTATWAMGAWAMWGLAILNEAARGDPWPELRYVALCVTCGVGTAVLGARRPGAGPWNFVVLGLLAVLLMPFAESGLTGKPLYLDTVRCVFLAGTLAIGCLNYLPTRLGGAALLLALGCATEIVALAGPVHGYSVAYSHVPAWAAWPLLVPWVALLLLTTARPATAGFDRQWLAFRNRFGLVWSQRLREQFNNAAMHAGWPVLLRWPGLRLRPGKPRPLAADQEAMLATLQALMKRFGPD